jgi:LPXTG-motif cell wall-anchored protein
VTISKLMAAAGIAAASFVGFVGVAHAAPVTSEGTVSCVIADGELAVQADGNDASVSGTVSCDSTACAEGALSIVTDDAGVQHQACVASAADAPVVPVASQQRASLTPRTTGTAATTTTPASLPKTGAGMGGVLIAAILVGSGSVASLIARRKSS